MFIIAIYHCSIKIISRGTGKSAVAAAAYRSGENLTNEWDGMVHDYTRKGGIVHSEILLPPNAPTSFADRGTLWNSVEQSENTGNAQLAREIEVALPVELSFDEQLQLIREYCKTQFVSKGMVADFSIHNTGTGNPHCHIMLTMRPMDEQGRWLPKSKKEYVLDDNSERIRLPSGRYKTRKVDLVDWNSRENAEVWRAAWANLANQYLEQSNSPERIDHRSFERQGIDQIPTVHVGVAASQMEKKGIPTERGELNRNIKAANKLIREIRSQVEKLKAWLGELFTLQETMEQKSPLLSDLLLRYLDIQRERSRKYSVSWQQKHTAEELKSVSKSIILLEQKGIVTLEDLDNTLSAVNDNASEIRSRMKSREKRMRELQKHIEHAETYIKHKPVHDELKQIRWTSRKEAFAEEHRAELTLWEAANRYLYANVPDMKLPVAEWKSELAALTAENTADYQELKQQKESVAELQRIRRNIEVVLKQDEPRHAPERTADKEL